MNTLRWKSNNIIKELIIKDTVRSLISLDLSKFLNYSICSSVVEIEVPKIFIYSSIQLSDMIFDDKK